MAKVTFYVSTGCKSSQHQDVFDTVEDLGYNEGEWEAMSEDEKELVFQEWLWDKLDATWWEN